MPLLVAENLTKSFGAVKVADAFSFALEAGEAVGIIGPNGAGKTSLFNLISGNLRPESGRILLDGREMTQATPHQRCRAGIGRTYQIPQPFTNLSVFENCLAAASFATGRSERQCVGPCAEVLRRTGLLKKANEDAGRLTLIERKRLELARALCGQPRLLLLDEIAGGLTEAETSELVELIREIHATGVAIVWIEHVVNALLESVGRLMVIDAGRKAMDGEPRTVIESDEVKRIYMGIG